ncbi:MAG: ribosome maturation factor RimM [Legionellales bacterium]|nr:ribosome maturation factor RimM [Legionellales bacterium]
MIEQTFDPVIVGRFGAAYGIKGWVHVQSFTDPLDNILNYFPWHIQRQGQWQEIAIANAKLHGTGLVVQVAGCNDRDLARLYTNNLIAIDFKQLPDLSNDEYYWEELLNLTVVNLEQIVLGKVTQILATGANDVLVVKDNQQKERLIPFTMGQAIKQVDLNSQIITVDWDADF